MCAKACCRRTPELEPKSPLISGHFHAENFARLAFGDHFKRPAADLAIGGEPLPGQAGVDDQLASLPAVRAKGFSEFFHAAI